MAYFHDSKTAQNSAFFVSSKTGLSDNFYGKRKLVPFGEYTPKWASFIGKVVPAGDMERGKSDKPIEAEIAGKTYKIGPMICYEDIFPQLGREMALNGADLLFLVRARSRRMAACRAFGIAGRIDPPPIAALVKQRPKRRIRPIRKNAPVLRPARWQRQNLGRINTPPRPGTRRF